MIKHMLILSNCTYDITAEDSERVLNHLTHGEKLVRLRIDLFGENKTSEICINAQHIVALAEYQVADMSIAAELTDRVTPLRR
jgi:hypothetical protein